MYRSSERPNTGFVSVEGAVSPIHGSRLQPNVAIDARLTGAALRAASSVDPHRRTAFTIPIAAPNIAAELVLLSKQPLGR
jgi:hypothetical protein